MFDLIFNAPSFAGGLLVGVGVTLAFARGEVTSLQDSLDSLTTVYSQIRRRLDETYDVLHTTTENLERELNLNDGLTEELAAQAGLVK